jgi:hypothetical protein
MGCDGINMFQGVKINVTTQMKENVVLFLMGLVHQINTNVLILSRLNLFT